MLKYSFMTFACPGYSLEEVVESAVRHGYDGVEPRVVSNHKHGIELERTPAERAGIRKQFEDAGVAVACIATSVQLNKPDAAQRQEMVDQAKAYVELAADLGARRIRVFGGHADDQADVMSGDRDTAIGRVIEGLAACAGAAASREVFICLETHDFFCPGVDVARICDAVDSPWIQATWDVQHPVTAGEDISTTESVLMPFVRHVHFHDTDRSEGRNECVPIGQGQAPISQFLAIFKKHNYDGFISGEWFYNNGPEKDLAHYISACKAIEESL